MRYHVNPQNGNASICRAKKSCPFGDMEKDHYTSEADARGAYEKRMGDSTFISRKYPELSAEHSMEIARTIRSQINTMSLMTVGASDFFATNSGLRFNARILPFNESGTRSSRPAKMTVEVRLNGLDLYDVSVYRVKKFDVVNHYQALDVDAFSLSKVIESLDYDGEEVTNPRL